MPLEGQLAVSRYWAPSSVLVYSGPPCDKPVDVSETHLGWPYDTGRLTRRPQYVCEISTSQQWSGVERQLASEGYGI